MKNFLIKQIEERMHVNNLTIYGLENKAGLKRSAVRNIITGASKKPSVAILQPIAKVFGCTVEDLIGSSLEPKETIVSRHEASINPENFVWISSLFEEAVRAVSHIVEQEKHVFSYQSMVRLIQEVYKYSLLKETNTIDYDFCKWLIRQEK